MEIVIAIILIFIMVLLDTNSLGKFLAITRPIKENLKEIECDMNNRNNSKTNRQKGDGKTRRRRQELSMSATKSIKKEKVEVVVTFD